MVIIELRLVQMRFVGITIDKIFLFRNFQSRLSANRRLQYLKSNFLKRLQAPTVSQA